MDDVTFSFQVESARRALYACDDPGELRLISVKVLEMMVYQRQVVRKLLSQAMEAEGYQSKLRSTEEEGLLPE